MLESVEAEIDLAGGVGMAVDGDDAAFFTEFGVGGDWDQRRCNRVSMKLTGCIGDSRDPLEEAPDHAWTSP
jgi:hypothetical protein